ncbi:MAG: PE family protein, partial [Mycobacterium sp.]
MSFVVAVPEQVQAAAHDLAGIRSMLAEASSSVAFPTTAVVPAAADEVSAAIATLFGNFGQQYQLLSAQAQAFHTEFVDLLNAGAGAYLSTEIANAEQNLLNAVNGPVRGLVGMSGGGAAAQLAALPILGGLGGGTPIGQSLGGVVTALQHGSAVSLLSGQIGTGLQTLSRDITGLTGLGSALAPGMLQTGASTTGLADIAGPYETLFANTATNLQVLGDAWLANPLPFLHQFITNQIGYAETLAAGVEYLIQNLPAVLANLPANIQAAIQALLAFDPAPYIQQFINNQMAYAQLIGMSLQNAAQSFSTGLQALPAAFQSAFQALQTGNIGGAVSDVAQGVLNLFVTGADVTTTGSITVAPGIVATVTPGGTLGDLLPILTVPGMVAQNFTNLLPPGSIPAQISQNFTNVLDTVTDTSLGAPALLTIRLIPPSANLSVDVNAGLPVALVLDTLGAPVNALNATSATASQFVAQLQTGNLPGAIGTLIDSPAVVTDAFLNGQSTLPINFDISGNPTTINLPLNGILVPQTGYTASITLTSPPIGTITVGVGGT